MSRQPPKKRRQARHLNPKDPASARGPGRSIGRRRGGFNDAASQSGGRNGRRQMREDLRTHQLDKLEDALTWEGKSGAQDRRNPARADGVQLHVYGAPRWARVIEAYRGHCLIKPLTAAECAAVRGELVRQHQAAGRTEPELDALDPALLAPTPGQAASGQAASGQAAPAPALGLAARWLENQYLRAGWRRVFEHYAEISRNLVCVGDCVRFVMTHEPQGIEDIAGVITDILQGERSWERVAWGGRGVQRIVSNVDQMLMVVSTAHPEFRPGLIDRFLCLAEYEDLPLILAVNKWDLLPGADPAVFLPTELPALSGLSPQAAPDLPPVPEEPPAVEIEQDLRRDDGDLNEEAGTDIQHELEVYERMQLPVFRVCAATGFGLERLRQAMVGKITAVSGHSGVGKSSVLSRIFPGLQLRVGEVSTLHGKGRHTTTNVTWIDRRDRLPERTVVVDTPGLRTFGLWGIQRPGLDYLFRDFRPFLGNCKLPNCSHHHEPKCGVKTAVEAGQIDPRRYASFLRIYRSLPG
ncbi:MAG: ribosome small subunit-dependent GTPase A [Planctomycetota bacterium]